MSIIAKTYARLIHMIAIAYAVWLLHTLPVEAQEQDEKPSEEISEILRANSALEARAKAVADALRRRGFVDLVRNKGSRVRGLLGVTEDVAGRRYNPVYTETDSSVRAILFVSSSVPLPTLRAYAAQLEKANGVIVFRGVPGGMSRLKPLISLTQKIILRDPNCKGHGCDVFNVGVIIDPLMFEANYVDSVPALTIVDHDPFAAYCERPDEVKDGATGHFVTFGDAHLTGHLEALIELGDPRARKLLQHVQQAEADDD